jgi:uncharacterized membrane protein YgdD (TMEM256/DUF423 family)
MSDRTLVVLAAAFAFTAVAAGAFGAHALKDRLSTESLGIFETGARYQMYHALALFAVAWAGTRWDTGQIAWSGWLFVAGIVIFSGSLYLLALTGTRWLGAITPIGGVCLLAGWISLAWGVLATR